MSERPVVTPTPWQGPHEQCSTHLRQVSDSTFLVPVYDYWHAVGCVNADAAKDQRIAELEGLLRESVPHVKTSTLRGANALALSAQLALLPRSESKSVQRQEEGGAS